MLLRDPDEDILYLFYDDNQNLYGSEFQIPTGLTPVCLTRNCRNTRRIHESFVPFYRSEQSPMPRNQGPERLPVYVDLYASEKEMLSKLRGLLHRLIAE